MRDKSATFLRLSIWAAALSLLLFWNTGGALARDFPAGTVYIPTKGLGLDAETCKDIQAYVSRVNVWLSEGAPGYEKGGDFPDGVVPQPTNPRLRAREGFTAHIDLRSEASAAAAAERAANPALYVGKVVGHCPDATLSGVPGSLCEGGFMPMTAAANRLVAEPVALRARLRHALVMARKRERITQQQFEAQWRQVIVSQFVAEPCEREEEKVSVPIVVPRRERQAVPSRPLPVPAFRTGPYIGVFGGFAWPAGQGQASIPLVTPLGDPFFRPSNWNYGFANGGLFGVTAGFNYQLSSNVMGGIEVEGGYLHISGSGAHPQSSSLTAQTTIGNSYGLIAARFGIFGSPFFYVKFGAAFANSSASVTIPTILATSGSQVIVAPAVGGGIEMPLGQNWSAKAEYLYLDLQASYMIFGTFTVVATVPSNATVGFPSVQTLKFGVNYRFD